MIEIRGSSSARDFTKKSFSFYSTAPLADVQAQSGDPEDAEYPSGGSKKQEMSLMGAYDALKGLTSMLYVLLASAAADLQSQSSTARMT